MASDATWNVRGLAPEVRETAREAARRSGLTVAQWLQSVIVDSAAEKGVARGRRRSGVPDEDRTPRRTRRRDHDREDEYPVRAKRPQPEPEQQIGSPPDDQVRALDARLELLSQQLERLARAGTQTAMPPQRVTLESDHAPAQNAELASALRAIEMRLAEFGREAAARAEGSSQQVATTLAQLDRRLDALVTDGRSASSELETRIAAVDRALSALNRESANPPAAPAASQYRSMPASPPPQVAAWSDHSSHAGAGFEESERVPMPSVSPPRSLSAAAADHEESRPPRPTLSIQHAAPVDPAPERTEIAALPVHPAGESFGLDDAIAEIAARQQALDVEDEPHSALDRQFARLSERLGVAERPQPENEDLSSLQHQLRHLTSQLETLRRPGGFEDAIAALRQELADIGRKLTEAAPRRALQALEAEVHTLADRVDIGRHRGGDAATLASIERGLAEVRDALHRLAPAESLAAFREEVRTLDRKIDAVAAGGSDSTALQHLERAISELREIASRAASGDALIALAEEVQTLGDKIDRIVIPVPGADGLSHFDQRFAQLAASLEARVAAAGPASAGNLVSVVEALADKIERMEVARESGPALDQIAAQLGRLSEKLETSGARLAHLDTIERGLSELFDQLEGLQASAAATAQRAAKDAALEVSSASAGAAFEVEGLKLDLGALRQNQAQSDRRTQDTLEAVHDTLERLVDRLAMVETDMRGTARASATTLPATRPFEPPPAPVQVPQPEFRRTAPVTAAAGAPVVVVPHERRPIDPTLPADHPLEPGTATPRTRAAASPAERIAASEAALDGVKPAAEADSKANFIAAARRAAQAAAAMAAPSGGAPPEESKASTSTFGAIAQKLAKRRPLLLGVAILLIAGTLHVVLNVFGTNHAPRTETHPAAQRTAPNAEPAKLSGASSKPLAATTSIVPPTTSSNLPPLGIVATASRPAPPLPAQAEREPARETGSTPRELSPAPLGNLGSTSAPETAGSAPAQGHDARTTPGVSPLTIATMQLPTGDVTGSTGRPTGFPVSNAAPVSNISGAPAAGADRLPGAVSPGLRTAALSGNPAAEHEIAIRYAEGRGGPVNLEEAARWFERAAEHGSAPAQYRLGSLYEKGQGVKKDLEKARRLYTSAADKGNGKAMHNLAVLHAEGVDGKPDFKAAAQWFRKAADRGVADSQYNLAILHARGLGVEQNLAESYKWFALAAQQGDQDAGKKRDDVASRLDQQALVAARLAVQTFTAAPQPEEATTVKPPAGGWDAAAAPAPQGKPKNAFPPRRTGSS